MYKNALLIPAIKTLSVSLFLFNFFYLLFIFIVYFLVFFFFFLLFFFVLIHCLFFIFYFVVVVVFFNFCSLHCKALISWTNPTRRAIRFDRFR
jgi:hypothetical protein